MRDPVSWCGKLRCVGSEVRASFWFLLGSEMESSGNRKGGPLGFRGIGRAEGVVVTGP